MAKNIEVTVKQLPSTIIMRPVMERDVERAVEDVIDAGRGFWSRCSPEMKEWPFMSEMNKALANLDYVWNGRSRYVPPEKLKDSENG